MFYSVGKHLGQNGISRMLYTHAGIHNFMTESMKIDHTQKSAAKPHATSANAVHPFCPASRKLPLINCTGRGPRLPLGVQTLRTLFRLRFEVQWTWERESRGRKPKSLDNVSWARVPKVRKKSRRRSEKSPKTRFQTYLDFSDLFTTFSDLRDPGPGDFFESFSRLFQVWLRDSLSQVHGTCSGGKLHQEILPCNSPPLPFSPRIRGPAAAGFHRRTIPLTVPSLTDSKRPPVLIAKVKSCPLWLTANLPKALTLEFTSC